MYNALNFCDKIISVIEKFIMYIAAITLVFMTVIIVADTILRHFFSFSIVGVLELVEGFLMVAIVFFGISDTFRAGEHISIDLLSKNFTGNLRKINEIIINLIVSYFFIIIGIKAYHQMAGAFVINQTTTGALEIPIGPAYLIVVIGSFLFSAKLLITILNLLFNQTKED